MNQKGQALIEYLLIIALIILAVVGIMKLLSGHVYDLMTKVTCEISYKVYVEGDKPGEGYCADPRDLEEEEEE